MIISYPKCTFCLKILVNHNGACTKLIDKQIYIRLDISSKFFCNAVYDPAFLLVVALVKLLET